MVEEFRKEELRKESADNNAPGLSINIGCRLPPESR